MLHARCPQCTELVAWRPVQGGYHASCCAFIFDAVPIEGSPDFCVTTKDAYDVNVLVFPPRRWYR